MYVNPQYHSKINNLEYIAKHYTIAAVKTINIHTVNLIIGLILYSLGPQTMTLERWTSESASPTDNIIAK